MDKPTEHQHMSDEKSRDVAQKILLMENIGHLADYETLEDWDEALVEANFNKTVIVCNECREKIFRALEEIRPQISTTEETELFVDINLVKRGLELALKRYTKGKEAMMQMGPRKKEELEQMLKEFVELEYKTVTKDLERRWFKIQEKLGHLTEQEKDHVPTEKELKEISFMEEEMRAQIVILRALLGKNFVIGDEAFLAEYGHVSEEAQEEST